MKMSLNNKKPACRPQNLMLANLSLTSVMTLCTYVTANLLERFPLIPYNQIICGLIVHIFRKQHLLELVTVFLNQRIVRIGKFYLGIIQIPELHLPVEGLTVMFLSMDRTRAVRRPLEQPKMTLVRRRIAVIWAFALLLNIPAGYMIAAFAPENKTSHFKCKWVGARKFVWKRSYVRKISNMTGISLNNRTTPFLEVWLPTFLSKAYS